MWKDKTLLVTGGTGSFGQAFIREALKTEVRSIRIFSRGEYLQAEMKREFNDDRLRFLIGDIRDKERLCRAMNYVDYVVHCAALKRVEVCEYNPIEAHKTNVDGSENLVNAAIDNHVEKVLAVSSDKAVHPINVYGTTKQMMERLIIGGNIYGDTKFSCIRSGNFVSSRGNVFETWQKEIEVTNSVTVTDENMVRYWIGLDILVRIALQWLEKMAGGEIFIPKMERVVLKNLIPPDVTVNHTGARLGEKLTELLFNEGEIPEDCGDYWTVRVHQAGGNL